jgi:peptidoglycan hydrolase CwlO-like protein
MNLIFSDLEQELGDKQAGVQLLEREVTEGRRRCTELEEELDQVNKEIGEARVWKFHF